MRPAGIPRRRRYEALRPDLIKQKQSMGGLIGLKQGERVWIVNWPWCVKKTKEVFANPVQACARYNWVLLKVIGEDAVMCDPLAAVQLRNFDEPGKRGRPKKVRRATT